MSRPIMLAFAIALPICATGAGFAQADGPASAEEAAKVREAIAKVGCQASEIEKEDNELFEIDDAQCAIGQYDIKLDGNYNIRSMTRD